MIFPCETVLKRFVPAIKAKTAVLLYEKYSFSQVEIAQALGITQAAVSKYLAGKYGPEIRDAIELPSVTKNSYELAKSISEKEPMALESASAACACCRELRSGGLKLDSVKNGVIRISSSCDL